MFKSIAATLSMFFATILSISTPQGMSQNIDVIKENTSIAINTNYFYYIDPTHIKCRVNIGQNKSINTNSVKKNFYISNIVLVAPNCNIQEISLQNNTLINDMENISFTATLQNECIVNQINFSAKKIIENIVTVNGKTYSGKKEEKIKSITLLNKKPVSTESYSITFVSRDGNNTIVTAGKKSFVYTIKNRNGQISNRSIEEVVVRTLDGTILALEKDGKTVSEIDGLKSSFGQIVLQAFERTGDGKIEIDAKIKNSSGIVQEIKEVFTINIEQKKEEILANLYKILILTKDRNFLLKTNDKKEIIYQIVDKYGNEIEEQYLQSLFIKSYNGLVVKIEDSNGTLHNEYTISSPQADGKIVLRSFERSDNVPIKIKVAIKNGEKTQEISREFFINVSQLPNVSYELLLSFDHDNLIINKADYLNYTILSPSTNDYILPEEIKSIEINATSPNAVCIDMNGSEVKSYFVPTSYIQSHGFFFVMGKKRGLATFKVTVNLQNGKTLTKFISTNVDYTYDNKIGLEYAGTEYNESTGFFIDTYTIKIKDPSYEGQILHVTAINPKIDNEYYYKNFFSYDFDEENPFIYYDGLDNEPNSGILEGNQSLGYTFFQSSRYDLDVAVPNDDRLLILPNFKKNSATYLGNWDIIDTIGGKLYLRQYYNFHESGLSFVIGNEQRFNPVKDTIATIFLDHKYGKYIIKNQQVQIKLFYPTFFAGKDIFIGVYVGEGIKREGNSFKRTLTGIKLAQPQLLKCSTSPCSQIVQINFEKINKHLQYSRFAVKCKMDKIRDYYFTPLSLPCVTFTDYGRMVIQKTDGNGKVRMCIYPEPTYEEVEEGGQTYRIQSGYEEVTPECTFTVAEEFPY
ncbi:hypothetical protein [Nitratiruptor tergarcus]|uniref:Uncharacterized protein n=1 Tax=Nitratiruptor tergarcus DSM 16512 TaxID=1069081 RepID=A0A1W1WSZ1_9BACT|nr:hypothetical protein [Nitratiruptor tergarcus]SMC09421.1 hypothetical protein SAMN05660197_1229 [Nitratiruptor tergarcus DSM 16512]